MSVWCGSLFCAHGVRVKSTPKNPIPFRAFSCVVNYDFKATLGWPWGESKDACDWAPISATMHRAKCTRRSNHAATLLQNVLSASNNLWFKKTTKSSIARPSLDKFMKEPLKTLPNWRFALFKCYAQEGLIQRNTALHLFSLCYSWF